MTEPDYQQRSREQRIVIAIAALVAGLPICCQLLMAFALQLHAGGFPRGEHSLANPRFWSVQVVLLCVSVSGNAIVDWIRVMRAGSRPSGRSLKYFLGTVLLMMFVSIMFSVSLLDDQIGWPWLAGMAALALSDLGVAWMLQMALLRQDP